MMSRFAQTLQGKGPRLPKTIRPAFYGCLIGIGLSQLCYPSVRADLVRAVVESPVPVKVAPGNQASSTQLDSVGRFLIGLFPVGRPENGVSTLHFLARRKNHADPIRVTSIRGAEGPDAEARLVNVIRKVLAIARRIDNETT